MTAKILPTAEYLRECFRYEAETGKLFWLERPLRHFANLRACNAWNAKYPGREALTAISTHGYFYGPCGGIKYFAHRIIWKIVTGEEPPPIVDHTDRNIKDNRWENLRAATKSQNNINSTVKRGVCFDKSRNKWVAQVKKNGKRVYVKRFDTEQEAVTARAIVARQLFGEFAP